MDQDEFILRAVAISNRVGLGELRELIDAEVQVTAALVAGVHVTEVREALTDLCSKATLLNLACTSAILDEGDA